MTCRIFFLIKKYFITILCCSVIIVDTIREKRPKQIEEDNKITSKSKPNLRFKIDKSSLVVTEVLRDRGWSQLIVYLKMRKVLAAMYSTKERAPVAALSFFKVDGESNLWDLHWCDLSELQNVLKGRLNDNQLVPNFWNFYELSRKTLLARNMNKLRKKLIREGKLEEAKICDCIPMTFELPAQYLMFVEEHRNHSGQTWIVKPGIGSRGRGIFLFRKLKDLNDWKATKDFQKPSPEGDELLPDIWLVQKYIENPYLLGGKKFDIRFFVLVQSFTPLKVWVNREGFARMSGTKYSISEIKDNYIHLTNASLQLSEKCASEDNHKQGQKWHLHRLREMLTARHGPKVIEDLIQKLGKIILTSLHSVEKLITHNRHSFELFGYDVLLDDKLNPWLLEINSRPSLDSTDKADHDLKYNMVSDVMNVLDLEAMFSRSEIRIGGFDLLYDSGPIYMPCPGGDELGPMPSPHLLNIFLGALNDRNDQLRNLRNWQKFLVKNN